MYVAMPLILAHLVVARLDVGRFGWSGAIPLGAHIAGLAGMALCMALGLWMKNVNPFAEPTIRIQRERSHHVIADGPYRYVRHPGYVAGQLGVPCSALALGSWWAMLPAGLYALLLLRRAVIEDRFLRAELNGYDQYAQQVRYRLIPGIF